MESNTVQPDTKKKHCFLWVRDPGQCNSTFQRWPYKMLEHIGLPFLLSTSPAFTQRCIHMSIVSLVSLRTPPPPPTPSDDAVPQPQKSDVCFSRDPLDFTYSSQTSEIAEAPFFLTAAFFGGGGPWRRICRWSHPTHTPQKKE